MHNKLKKHLNWTLAVGVIIIESPLTISMFILPIVDENAMTLVTIAIITITASLILRIWYLYQKKRSYAYLLLSLIKPFYIPVGFILMLCLENRRTATPYPENKVMV